LKVALLEYICGSGILRTQSEDGEPKALESLLSEGHAMLSALARDLIDSGIAIHCPLEPSIAHWGRWRAWTDPQWHWSAVPFDDRRSIDDVASLWIDAAKGCDAAIVIAPELDGVLTRIVSRLRDSGVQVLVSDRCFLETASDQWQTCQAWRAAGVRHPKTYLLSEFPEVESPESSPEGWILKRRDSAGCVGQQRFENFRSVAEHAGRWRQLGVLGDAWIVQPWVPGLAASLAALVGNDIRVLGAFEQRFQPLSEDGQTGWGYVGGHGPIPGVTLQDLQRFASDVLTALPGVPRGWVGIDFLIEPDGRWSAIEVNPRLTTSYLGYRQWYGPRIAEHWVCGSTPAWDSKDFPDVCFSVDHFEG
jgi:predicted ATP-grasp superfamily ATP-dependent carboligase